MKCLFTILLQFPRQWGRINLAMALALICVLAAVSLLAVSGWLISASAFAGLTVVTATTFNYFIPAAAIRGLALIRILSRYGERVVGHQSVFTLLRDLRVWVYQKIEPLAPAHLWQYQSGDLLNRFISDIDALNYFYLRFLSPVVTALLLIGMLGVGLSLLNATLAITVFGFMLVAVFGVCGLSYKIGCLFAEKIAHQQRLLYEHLLAQLQNLMQLALYRAHSLLQTRFFSIHQTWMRAQTQFACWQAIVVTVTTVIGGAVVVMALYFAIPLVHDHALNGAWLALVVLAIMGVFEAIIPLPSAFQKLAQTKLSALRVTQLLNATPEVNFVENNTRQPQGTEIKITNVSFRYPNSVQYVLKNFNLTIAAGKTLIISGPIGAGKTTLLQLLTRCYDPTAGSICVGGVDIRQLSENTLRQTICLASQHAHIFNDTLKANLLVANPLATDSQLWEVLAMMQLKDFVAALPNSLETELGEFGCRLSGGQIRRIALARTLLSTAPIILWDEPSEGIDAQTFHEIWVSMGSVWSYKTLIVVSHQRIHFLHEDATVLAGWSFI